jgi:glycosyltransferase involved in cell wall biosynthesis
MTRLVHLAGYTPEQRGSFIPFLLSVLSEGRRRGWEVDAVFPEEARGRPWVEELREAGISVEFASGSRRELTAWLEERVGGGAEPTILHTHFTIYDVPAALIARKRASVAVYWHIHTVLLNNPRAVAANAAKFTLFGRYVDRILTPSVEVAGKVKRRRFGDRAGKVSVVPSAIDPDAFPILTPAERSEFRDQLGVPQNREVILHFGRDWHLKDGDIFLDAVVVLIGAGREVIGLINQGGEAASGAAKERGIEPHLRLTGMIPDPKALYGAADVLVASSRGEGMPYSVVESLCSGTPVVASDLPGHRFLGDELDACTIVPRDARQIAAGVTEFLEMDQLELARSCETAREWIAQRLDVRVVATELVDQYEDTIGDPGA